jgi:hypothetical protein
MKWQADGAQMASNGVAPGIFPDRSLRDLLFTDTLSGPAGGHR